MSPKRNSFYLLIMMFFFTCIINSQTSKSSVVSEKISLFRNDASSNVENNNSDFLHLDSTNIRQKVALRSVLTLSQQNPTPGDTSHASTEPKYTSGCTFYDVMDKVLGPTSDLASSKTTKTSTVPNYVLPIVWMKITNVTNNLNGAYVFKDVFSNQPVYKYNLSGSTKIAEYKVTRDKIMTYNFNPAINLSYQEAKKLLPIYGSNLSQATIIGVWGILSDYTNDKILYTVKGRENDSLNFTKKRVLLADINIPDTHFGLNNTRSFVYNSTNVIEGTDVNKFAEKSLRVATYYRSNQPNHSLWGESNNAVVTLFDSLTQATKYSKSTTPEMLFFDHQLTPLDCRKYESYLAIKYGISLDTSYYSANGTLIWNYPANVGYNNRITGYGRDDAMGLFQKVSTTSYEEGPYYSNQKIYESYDSCNSYRMSSSSRLLVIGAEPGNNIKNGDYYVFGDNGGSLDFVQIAPQAIFGSMSRKWLLTTNAARCTDMDKDLYCQINDLDVVPINIYKCNITKNPSSNTSSLISYDPLVNKNGYLAWTVGSVIGPVVTTFGTSSLGLSANYHNYGYGIDVDGKVYSVIDGQLQNTSLCSVQSGQRIEVEKNDRVIYMRINSVRYKNTEIRIDSIQSLSPFYGSVYILGSLSTITLTDFRNGGVVNSGNRVELSYLTGRASAFSNPNWNECLMIDRTGTGNFTDQTEYHFVDEWDYTRSKIIFKNIFWDTDGNGKDVFTFGYWPRTSYNSSIKKLNDDLPDIEDSNNNALVFYKNLSDLSTVTVRIQMNNPKPAEIFIYDLLGKCIERRQIINLQNVRCLDIHMSKPGMYIIKVISGHLNYSQKVIFK